MDVSPSDLHHNFSAQASQGGGGAEKLAWDYAGCWKIRGAAGT